MAGGCSWLGMYSEARRGGFMRLVSRDGGSLRCYLGNHEAREVEVLEIPGFGSLGCVPCCKERGIWCERHDCVYGGFTDGTAACFRCIEEEVDVRESEGALFLQEIEGVLPAYEVDDLNDWFEVVVPGAGSHGRCFTRALVTRALRTKVSLAAIIEEIRKTNSVVSILPYPFA